MGIIFRYILSEFLSFFLVCLLSLIFIAVLFTALPELETLARENGWKIFRDIILSTLPLLIEVITPISVLLATVLTFISLSKSSEIVAMMAAGIGLYKVVRPVLFAGIIICALLYFNQSYLASRWGADKRTNLFDLTPSGNVWYVFKGDLFRVSNPDRKIRKVPEINRFRFDEKNRLSVIDIKREVTAKGETWISTSSDWIDFSNNRVTQNRSENQSFSGKSFPILFVEELPYPKYSPFLDIISEIRLKRMGALNYDRVLFALYQKIGGILSIFVMILLALPFSLFSGRDANIKTGIVTSILMGLIFWLIDQIFISLNGAGLMIIEVSAFGANVIFTLLALSLIFLRNV